MATSPAQQARPRAQTAAKHLLVRRHPEHYRALYLQELAALPRPVPPTPLAWRRLRGRAQSRARTRLTHAHPDEYAGHYATARARAGLDTPAAVPAVPPRPREQETNRG